MPDPLPLTNCCPYCERAMRTREMACERCEIAVRGTFPATPLTSLPAEHQRFIEMFILASGNLKEIASLAGVSYPTVRNRLDKVIDALRVAIENQTAQTTQSAETAQPPKDAETGVSVHTAMADAARIIKRIGSS